MSPVRTLGAALSALRAERGQSLAAFAQPLGVTRQRLHDIEAGRQGVSPARAAQWALALGEDPAEFVQLAVQELLHAEGLHGLTVAVTGKLRAQ